MSKGGSNKVYRFYYSIAVAVCVGPIDAFNFIRMKDKIAQAIRVTASRDTELLDKPKLFGGDKGEGGPAGYVDYRMGDGTQLMSETHASKHEDVPANLPGYRWLTYLFFHGRGGDTLGFRWTTNSAYFPEISCGVTRFPRVGATAIPTTIWPIVGIDEETSEYILAVEGDAHAEADAIRHTHLPDANPAAIIYEALTADWGKRELPAAVNEESFVAAGTTLQEENFGLSLIFTAEMEIEKFIGEILDHIRAVLYEHPVTGQWHLDLIRDDYELESLPVLNPSNATMEKLVQRSWGDTINHITVTYTNPENEEDESVSAMNYANITIQGGERAEARNYFAVRNPWLALELAERDVFEASRTLKSLRMTVARGTTALLPGKVVIVNWPEENITGLVCRVMKLDLGSSDDRSVTLELTEDVFASKKPVGAFGVQPALIDTPPAPADLDNVFIFSPPAPVLTQIGVSAVDLAGAYPEAGVAFLANSSTYSPDEIDAWGSIALGNGGTSLGTLATFTAEPSGTLGTTLAVEVRSSIPTASIETLFDDDLAPGMVLIIGDTEDRHELVMLDSESGTDWIVIRGLYDTLPLVWASSTVAMWSLEITDDNLDDGAPLVGVEEAYRFLPSSGGEVLDPSNATEYSYTPLGRGAAPFRPANCQIDANGFGVADYSAVTMPTTVPITWANRNRLSEDAVATAWDDGNVTPEVGQTTILRFRSGGGVVFEATELTGTSYDLDPSDLPPVNVFTVEFVSVRDGIECVYPATRQLILPNGGGWDYGWNEGWDQ